ncbi:uncharacterized protein LOC120346145 isoform X1 [Styela clava]
MRHQQIILIFLLLIASVSQACHLKSRCRKKRSFGRRGWNIHGGCLASKFGRMNVLGLGMELKDVFEKYKLTDTVINTQLELCVSKKINPISTGKVSFEGLSGQHMFRYYFVYLWAKDSPECRDHRASCNLIRDCVIHLLRAVLYS